MAVPQSIRDRYARDLPSLEALRTYVAATLSPWCSDRGYPFDGRVKTVESVAEKIETGRFLGWSDLDDLVAFTIIVPTVAHERAVLDMLDARFRTQPPVKLRGTTKKAPDVFRFEATRWYGRVPDDPQAPLDERGVTALIEVQVHTAFEHAWSTVTHDLVYKGQNVDWRYKRLAAQLKALVEQIDFVVDQFIESAEVISASSDPETDAQATILKTFRSLMEDGKLPETLLPSSWQRFAECVYALVRRSVRRREEAEAQVRKLCSRFEAAVESGDLKLAMSGSLFQAVVGHIAQTEGADAIGDFPIVQGGELKTFYGVTSTAKAFDLEA